MLSRFDAGASRTLQGSLAFRWKLCHKLLHSSFLLHVIFKYFCCILAAGTRTYREERNGIVYCVVYTISVPHSLPLLYFLCLYLLYVWESKLRHSIKRLWKKEVQCFVCLAGRTILVCYDANRGASSSYLLQRTGRHTSPQLERKKKRSVPYHFIPFSPGMSVSSVLYSVSFVICMYKYTYNIIMQIVVLCRKNPLELTNILYQLITLIAINTTWLSQSLSLCRCSFWYC